MVGRLLLRGMLIGIVAGLIGFGFARVFGEPSVEGAIAFEEAVSRAETASPPSSATPEAAPMSHGQQDAVAGQSAGQHGGPGGDLVSRSTQAGIGLLTGTVVYGAALGGILSLAFAFAYGRLGSVGVRGTAAIVGLMGFLAAIVVPAIKYPANPPAVGLSETIAYRTEFYFALLGLSVLAAILAVWLQRLLAPRFGGWNAGIVAGVAYTLAVAAVMAALPSVNEVPEAFSAALLWSFRTASLGLQAVVWAVLSLGLGWQAERLLAPGPSGMALRRRAIG